MKRTPLRIEPISTYLERYRRGANLKSVHPVVVAGELIYVSGLPPFDPATGEIARVPFSRQAELVLEQLKLCLETAGSSLTKVLKCNVYCTPNPSHFGAFNEVYDRYFAQDSPDFRARAVLARAVRRRDRLRGCALNARRSHRKRRGQTSRLLATIGNSDLLCSARHSHRPPRCQDAWGIVA